MLGLLAVAAVLWPISGWGLWPWAYGLGATLVVGATLGAIGAREAIGPAWILAAGLLVADGFLLSYTTPTGWGLAAGVVFTLLGIAAKSGRFGVANWVRLTALISGPLLLVTCLIVYAVGAVQQHRQQDQAEQRAREFQLAKMLPSSPRAVVISLVESIARRDPVHGCFVFNEQAAEQFARAHGAADCAGALNRLAGQITDWSDYVNNVWLPYDAETRPTPGSAVLDACQLEWSNFLSGSNPSPGPQLGRLTVLQQYGQGWKVVDYRPCTGS